MMTRGRLRAIQATRTRRNSPHVSLDYAHKHMDELIAEVLRLRKVLTKIIGGDEDDPWQVAHAALQEPDLGPPDIVCRLPGDCPKEKP